MHVNGAPWPYRDGLRLHDLLTELQVDAARVAVMHNDAIHRRGEIPDLPLAPTDVIEIVTIMQGG